MEREHHKEMEKKNTTCCAFWAENWDLPVSQKLQYFGREPLNYKDKGSRDFSGYSSLCVFWLEEEEGSLL